jgi:hypothetical protein
MPKNERPEIQLDDGERNKLLVGWSRSGKRLIVTVIPRGVLERFAQVELDTEQAEQLQAFLAETLAQ